MVSLDARNRFIDDLRGSAASCFTLALVLGEDCPLVATGTVADRASLAVISNDRTAFSEVIKQLEDRKIKGDADWVLDDFLLFTLLVGARKFGTGHDLCKAIIGQRRPTNELDIDFNDAMRSLSREAFAIEGAFAFVKLVFCDLTGVLRINKSVARIVYGELTEKELLRNLATFQRLLAYRAFDLLVLNGIEEELKSVDAIVTAIETQTDKMSIRDWYKIVIAVRPSAIRWIIGLLITICAVSFSLGRWFIPASGSPTNLTVPSQNVPVHAKDQTSRQVP